MGNKSRGGGVRNQRPGNTVSGPKRMTGEQIIKNGRLGVAEYALESPGSFGYNYAKKLSNDANVSLADAALLVGYTGQDFGEINNALYGVTKTRPTIHKARVAAADRINEVLDGLPKFEGEVHRYASSSQAIKHFDKMVSDFKKNGSGEVSFSGLLSTSRGDDSVYNSNRAQAGNFFKIKSKTGRDISKYSSYEEETEVLFRRGTKFNIVKVEERQGSNGLVRVVHMVEI